MEYLDVLDENGNKTGETKLRSLVHMDGNWHKVVFIFVVNSRGEIILQKRSKEKETNPNKWTASASGHVSAGDGEMETAIRELDEEIGMKVDEEEMQYLFTVKEQYVSGEKKLKISHISSVYIVLKDIDINDLTLQKEEVSDVKYINYKKFEEMVFNNEENIVKHDEIHNGLLKILHEKYD